MLMAIVFQLINLTFQVYFQAAGACYVNNYFLRKKSYQKHILKIYHIIQIISIVCFYWILYPDYKHICNLSSAQQCSH